MKARANHYVIIDVETTGLDPQRDRIIEIGAVKIKRGLVLDEFSSLIQPERPIPEEVTQLTGIDGELLTDAPRLAEVMPALEEFVDGGWLVAHNAPFDQHFLAPHWQEDRSWLDTLVLAQIFFPAQGSYSLENLCRSLEIDHPRAHRALGDAQATGELFLRCRQALHAAPRPLQAALSQLAQKAKTGALGTWFAQEVGEEAAATASPFYLPQRPLPSPPPEREVNESFLLPLEQIEAYLQPEGYYEQRLAGFEHRPQQLTMSLAVAEAFNDPHFLLAEAGTGTGKSLAYLLPAVLFALGSGRQVAISTHTINLQEQLLHKDIPLLKTLLQRDFKAAVLKGRSNYLCLSLLRSYLRQGEDKMLVFLLRLLVWLSQTEEGDGSQLHLTGADKWKWQLVAASKDNCLGGQCPHRNQCFVQRSRRQAEGADLFVLNHSLLLANAGLERGFLPELPYLIIDEAHHLERVAEDQLSSKVDFYGLLSLLGRLQRRERGKKTGLLPRMEKEGATVLGPAENEVCRGKCAAIEGSVGQTIAAAESFFTYLKDGYRREAAQGFFPASLRLTQKHLEGDLWQNGVSLGQGLVHQLKGLSRDVQAIWEFLYGVELQTERRLESKDPLKGIAAQLLQLAETLTALLQGDQETFVIWLEFADEERFPALCMSPLELGESLRNALLAEKKSVIFTSATLAAQKQSFAFFKQQVGLDQWPDSIAELVLPSPFHYREQALVAVCNDLPNLRQRSEVECVEAIAAALRVLIAASRGRAVVLFTSHSQLKSVYQLIRGDLAREGITVLAHGISGSPSHLLERLKREEHCCILGANSFWEGVDVVGSALSLVVVVRLPFWPPHTPVMAARLERLEAAGVNSFRNYSLPQAIIRFKQGFGRLIRSHGDQGVFCVLDKRLVEQAYGRYFLQALPSMPAMVADSQQVGEKIRQWLS